MPETVSRKSKVKTTPVKQVPIISQKDVQSTSTIQKKRTTTKCAVVSETKIKKILDEEKINKNVIEVINKIKGVINSKKEIKKELTDEELSVVSTYIDKNKKRLESESNKGKPISTNEIALRAFISQKYKFKRDLTTYLSVICDLMVEEIVSTSMERVLNANKRTFKTTHIVDADLCEKMLYPLYCKLPVYLDLVSTSTTTEDAETEVETETTDATDKVNRQFIGNVRSIFLKLRDSEGKLKIQKKYQEFVSTLLVEFLERLATPLLVLVKNNSKNRVMVQNSAATIVEILMFDYTFGESRYPELFTLIQERLNNTQ